jgi:hypothetical protein
MSAACRFVMRDCMSEQAATELDPLLFPVACVYPQPRPCETVGEVAYAHDEMTGQPPRCLVVHT